MLSVQPSRAGGLTATWAGRQLHSQFDPAREANRFVTSHIDASPSVAIVIGPGLGYVSREIESRYPRARVVSIHVDDSLYAEAVRSMPLSGTSHSWCPGIGEPLDMMLDRQLGELDTVAVSVVEWAPVTDVFAQVSKQIRESVTAAIRRRHGSLITEGAFGRRWFRNMIENFISTDAVYRLAPAEANPIAATVIAAAGPSLEESLPQIARHRSQIALWVTASALEAVVDRGLEPDLVVVTDAAFYAAEHLREVIAGKLPQVPVCAPLTATRGVHDVNRLVVLSQSDPMETWLLGEAKVNAMVVPPNGTVSGSALEIAGALGKSPVVFAGLDGAWKGVRSHVRPHIAHVYREQVAMRCAPALSTSWVRTIDSHPLPDGWISDRTLVTYSEWFRARSRREANLHRISPSTADVGIPSISFSEFAALPRSHQNQEVQPMKWPLPSERRRIARSVCDRCAASIRDLTPDAVRSRLRSSEGSVVALALLRRFELPAMIDWYRSDDSDAALGRIGESAIDAIESIGQRLP